MSKAGLLFLAFSLFLEWSTVHAFIGLKQRRSLTRYDQGQQYYTYRQEAKTSRRALPSEREQEREEQVRDGISTALLFGAPPLLSLVLPLLLQAKLFVPLFVVKRLFIYSMAMAIVVSASQRGARDEAALGGRLATLTQELLPDLAQDLDDFNNGLSEEAGRYGKEDEEEEKNKDERFSELQVLDSVGATAQSVALPLIVASRLVFSAFLLQLRGTAGSDLWSAFSLGGGGTLSNNDFEIAVASLRNWALSTALPRLTQCSNALVLFLFVRAELARWPAAA